jgi:hypothetical protein
LQLDGPDGPVELDAKVVWHHFVDFDRLSFHRRLGRYQGQTGELFLDDGRSVQVTVDGSWLDIKG